VGFDDFVFFSALRYYRGVDTGAQIATDDFTAQGIQMVQTSPPGAPVSVTDVNGQSGNISPMLEDNCHFWPYFWAFHQII
jgi:hypothetical protein